MSRQTDSFGEAFAKTLGVVGALWVASKAPEWGRSLWEKMRAAAEFRVNNPDAFDAMVIRDVWWFSSAPSERRAQLDTWLLTPVERQRIEAKLLRLELLSFGKSSHKRKTKRARSRRRTSVRVNARRITAPPAREAKQLPAPAAAEPMVEEKPPQAAVDAKQKKTNRHGKKGRMAYTVKAMCLHYCRLRLEENRRHLTALKEAAQAAVESGDKPDYKRAYRAVRDAVREKLENGRNLAALRRFLREG